MNDSARKYVIVGNGFAVKVDDGTGRASLAVTEALLQTVFGAAADFGNLGPIRNWRGTETGRIRTTAALDRTLQQLKS